MRKENKEAGREGLQILSEPPVQDQIQMTTGGPSVTHNHKLARVTPQSQVLTLAWSLTILRTISDQEVVLGVIALVAARPIGRVKTESLHHPVKTLLMIVAISLP